MYRSEAARLAPYEGLARMVIARRIRYGLTQGQLAVRMGTSVPAISRLESGQHLPSLATLERVARAFRERPVVGFEDEAGQRGRSPSSLGSDRPAVLGRRRSMANGFVGLSNLRRWRERGYIPASASVTIKQPQFTGFPPLLERELPTVKVEVID